MVYLRRSPAILAAAVAKGHGDRGCEPVSDQGSTNRLPREAHRPFWPRITALETGLASRLRERGYNVLGGRGRPTRTDADRPGAGSNGDRPEVPRPGRAGE